METALVWFRDDLRVTDNPTLSDAVASADSVLPVYVCDPRDWGETRYGSAKIGSHRARFRMEALSDLREQLRELGGELVVRTGNTATVLSELATEYDVTAVYTQTKPATEELERETSVRESLLDSVGFERRWTHTLYHLSDLPTPSDRIHDTFTPWRKEVERESQIRDPLSAPEHIDTPDIDAGKVPAGDAGEISAGDAGEIPSIDSLGLDAPETDDRAVCEFRGGERPGQQRLREYFWEGDHLREYKGTRNGMLGADYSSKFSPWLAAGCLSPRWIHREVKQYEKERISNQDTYWLVFELCWRDFFQFQFLKHGGRFFTRTGIRDVEKDWVENPEAFSRWTQGETGVPFVDANMRELNRTGYMSNRGRQNAASFLTDALGIDWRLGAAYFEQQLVDYDVCSNWGNWAYQAGVGNDSRDNYFNVLSQADRYDSDAAYVKTWLPELAGLPTEYAHRPWRMREDEQAEYGVSLGSEYPEPMLAIEQRYRELHHERS